MNAFKALEWPLKEPIEIHRLRKSIRDEPLTNWVGRIKNKKFCEHRAILKKERMRDPLISSAEQEKQSFHNRNRA